MNLKNCFSFRTKYSILLWLQKFKPLDFFSDLVIDSGKKQAYIFLAADYGNLGDIAITYAQTKFLKKNTDFQVIEIPISKSLEGFWFVKRNIKKGDVITTVGGGNMGDLYEQIEFIRQLVIRFFPGNQIISFPQTFDFEDNKEGRKALKKAEKVYNSNKNLTLVAREKTSFGLMQKHFPKAHVILTPDIVLSLDKRSPTAGRKGVVICMRKDAEKSLTDTENEFIIKTAEKHFGEVAFYDTHIGKNNLSIAEREEELNKIWSAFKSAELVITDRLHGMIFCQITGTPAIVFQNNNHKVRETYDWIKDDKLIHLSKDFDEKKVGNFIKNHTINGDYEQPDLRLDYSPLSKVLKK